MITRKTLLVVVGLIILLLAAGIAGALPGPLAAQSPPVAAPVASGISYQGRLASPDGVPLNGAHTMRFVVYDAPVAGSAVWDSGSITVTVDNGLFNVQLGVDQADFDGQALWLSIIIQGQTLSPRQEILPAPYALSLRPGAVIGASAPATGSALHADADGAIGLFGDSEDNYGVRGASNNSWGGYFTSAGGYGIRVESAGTAHFDHGAYITSQGGYGVYAQSAQNQAVRGEAGDVSGVPAALGPVGVVGMGANRGVYGASDGGAGVYGSSNGNYAGYFYSSGYRGLYASSPSGSYAGYFTNRGGFAQPGIYVNGTIVASGSKSGYVVDVSLNEGPQALEVGDVVAVVGVADPVIGEIPVMRVIKATADNAGAVVGVVDQRFVVDERNGEPLVRPDAHAPRHGSGNAIQAGEYVSIVTLGAFKMIKVDAAYGAISPGDLLVASPIAGFAMRATDPAPGAVIGKALEALETGQGAIAVYVTLQ